MKIYLIMVSCDATPIKAFKTKKKAIAYLKDTLKLKKRLRKKDNIFWCQDLSDSEEYDYWVERVVVEA